MTKEFTITFAGDTSLGDWYLQKPNRKNELERLNQNPFSYFEGIMPLVKNSDYFILNLETVLAEKPTGLIQGKEYPNYDNPERTLNILNQLGVSAVSLANNHAMDFGENVMLNTIKHLQEKGIESFGAGITKKEAIKPYKITLKGEKNNKNIYVLTGMQASRRYREDYGFFAENEKAGVNSAGKKRIGNQIKRIRKEDSEALIIVYPHWQGIDYKWVNEKIEDRCKEFIDYGADFIFAHGTHMANHIEPYKKGVIVYSIGNFIFNSPGRYKKLQAPPYSFIVNLKITEADGNWSYEPQFYPIVTDNKETMFNVQPATHDECRELTAKINIKQNKKNLLNIKADSENHFYFNLNKEYEDNIKENKNNKIPTIEDIILGKSKVPKELYKDPAIFDTHMQQLNEFQDKLHDNIYFYYEQLAENKFIYNDKKKLITLENILKKEFLSHKFVKKFERKKLNIPNAFSFGDIMTERAQLKRKGYKDLSWYLDKKISAYPFMEDIGIKVPYRDPEIYKFQEINKPLKSSVIKPVQSTGSMGVYLFFDDENIFSAREKIFLNSWDAMRNDALEKLRKWKEGKNNAFTKDEWMIEELIVNDEKPNSPPRDVKFHCFYGEVLLIQEESPLNYQNYCYWNNDMEMVFPRDEKDSREYFIGKGVSRDDLELVKQASLRIPTPYIRIDMLKGKNGLVFGEATPRTGKYHLFNKEFDRMLGEGYNLAEARLKRDLLKGKKFDEFTNHFKI